jgi:hypothetical protein
VNVIGLEAVPLIGTAKWIRPSKSEPPSKITESPGWRFAVGIFEVVLQAPDSDVPELASFPDVAM